MKTLIVIRHGVLQSENSRRAVSSALKERSQKNLTSLVTKLKTHLPSTDSVRVFTSPLLRAVKSAEVVAEGFGVSCEEQNFLEDSVVNDAGMAREIERVGPLADVIVIVTHAMIAARISLVAQELTRSWSGRSFCGELREVLYQTTGAFLVSFENQVVTCFPAEEKERGSF